ncbi:MAG: hypothetical protein ABI777_13170, partial [Betaproteobacteria bacterium]
RTTSLYSEGNSFVAGIRAAVLVVVLGAFAAAVDHVTDRPQAPLLQSSAVAQPTTTTVAGESFVVPTELHANEGDVTSPVSTF